MTKFLFPGSFDPPTLGHLDLIERASHICDKLYVAVATNATKKEKPLFTLDEKKKLLETITTHIHNIEIITLSGLVMDTAKSLGVNCLVRGLRAFSDFEYEYRMALANRRMGGLETLFLMADEKHAHISSTLIRELAHYKTRLHNFVPAPIEEMVYTRMCRL
jgi:pantetheine-phosphate adenylyltransferase